MTKIIDHTPAFALVGEFMFVWAHLENEMVQTIRALCGVSSAIESAILGANIGARDKTAAVKTLLLFHSPKRDDWSDDVANLINLIGKRYADRNALAHNPFSVGDKGGLKIFTVKAKGEFSMPDIQWPETMVRSKIDGIGALQLRLRDLTAEAVVARDQFVEMRQSAFQKGILNHLMTQPRSDLGSPPPKSTSNAESDPQE